MKRFDILDPSTNIRGIHFLEASAGTGKTFAIEHIVARLVIEGRCPEGLGPKGQRPIALEQILVMTFTNAATRELKMRIRSNLEKIARAIASPEEGQKQNYLFDLAQKKSEEKKAILRRVDEALACFSSAQIFTIHGFCQRMLSEFAFEANVPFGVREEEPKEFKTEIHSLVKDFFRSDLSTHHYSPRQIAVLLKKQKKISRLIGKLSAILEKGTAIADTASFQELHGKMQALFLATKGKYKADLVYEDFTRLSACYKKMGHEEAHAQAKKLAKILEQGECAHDDLDFLMSENEFFLTGMEDENKKVRAVLPDQKTLHYPGLFDTLRKSFYPLLEEVKDPSKIFLRMAKDCQKKMKAHLVKEERMHPDELLIRMQRALKNPAFLEKARNRYQAAIIDEFQDTDPVQWNLFSSLFLASEAKMKAVYLVGDPKQSIYAFRSADLYTYLQAKQAVGEESSSFLDTNFRSEPDLVNALNALFSSSKDWMSLPYLKKTLPFPLVKPSSDASNSELHDERGSVHFFLHEERQGREKKWPSQTLEEELIFPTIAKEMILLREQLGIEYGKMAVLIKDRFQEERLFNFLKKANISASSRKKAPLAETLSFSAMIDLLDAINDPHDFSKVKKLLAGPLVGWSQDDLRKEQAGMQIAQASCKLYSLQQRMEKKGFGALFRDFLLQEWSLTPKTVLEHLLSLDDLSLYFDLRHLADILIERSNAVFSTCQNLLLILKNLEKQSAEEDERGRIFNEEDQEKVHLITTHASKGLEFDFVFALGIASRHSSTDEWIRVKKDAEEHIEVLDLQNERTFQALREIDAEKMRQLYVALTRAKRRVYIPFLIASGRTEMGIGEASPLELFFSHHLPAEKGQVVTLDAAKEVLEDLGKKAKITYSFFQESILLQRKESEKKEIELKPPLVLHLNFREEKVFSFSSLAESVMEEGTKKAILDPKEKTPHSLPLGKNTGNHLHYLLEKTLLHRWHSPFNPQKIKSCLLQGGDGLFLEGWEDVLLQVLETAFFTPLLSKEDVFCIADIDPGCLQQEMEFLMPMGSIFLKGFIDLVFQFRGKYYLVDWKSNWLGPDRSHYQKSELEKAMREHDYFLQAALYANALERYVKLFDKRPFKDCFGGAVYLFLRGGASYHFFPDLSLLKGIESRIDERSKTWQE